LLVALFAYVEAYATVGFVRSAVVHRGITQVRLIAIAVGSGCLAAVIVLSGAATAAASTQAPAQALIHLLALASALGFYVGMAPPRWLRQTMQGAEVRRFLQGLSGLSGEQRLASTLEYLGPAAARATGGRAALVALVDDESAGSLDLHADGAARD